MIVMIKVIEIMKDFEKDFNFAVYICILFSIG